jgi:hypothetical protein
MIEGQTLLALIGWRQALTARYTLMKLRLGDHQSLGPVNPGPPAAVKPWLAPVAFLLTQNE